MSNECPKYWLVTLPPQWNCPLCSACSVCLLKITEYIVGWHIEKKKKNSLFPKDGIDRLLWMWQKQHWRKPLERVLTEEKWWDEQMVLELYIPLNLWLVKIKQHWFYLQLHQELRELCLWSKRFFSPYTKNKIQRIWNRFCEIRTSFLSDLIPLVPSWLTHIWKVMKNKLCRSTGSNEMISVEL